MIIPVLGFKSRLRGPAQVWRKMLYQPATCQLSQGSILYSSLSYGPILQFNWES